MNYLGLHSQAVTEKNSIRIITYLHENLQGRTILQNLTETLFLKSPGHYFLREKLDGISRILDP